MNKALKAMLYCEYSHDKKGCWQPNIAKNLFLMFYETKGHTGLWQHDNIFILDTLFIQNHSQKFMPLYGLILFWVGWGLCFCFSLTWHQITKYNELCQVVRAHMRVCVSFSQSHVTLSSYLLSLTRLPFWLERMVAVWLPCCCHTVPRWAVIGPPLGCKRQRHVDRQVWPPAPPPPLDGSQKCQEGGSTYCVPCRIRPVWCCTFRL